MDISSSCYPNIYTLNDDDDMNHIVNLSSSVDRSSNPTTGSLIDSSSPSSLLYNVSLLKDKVHHLHSLTTDLISQQNHRSTAANNVHGMANLLQEIIIAASSMMFTCQNMNISLYPGNNISSHNNNNNNNPSDTILEHHNHHTNKLGSFDAALSSDHQQPNYNSESTAFDWCSNENFRLPCNTSSHDDHNITTPPRVHVYHDHDDKLTSNNNGTMSATCIAKSGGVGADMDIQGSVIKDDYDIIEMEAADLLAKYTHYCHVCGKGFKRDANLRMHMRAHGDEYKSTAALSNPMKSDPTVVRAEMVARKYSCPQEGCRWNRKHAKFQPLKSMICVKNHYKRSHCPKMYVCKRCNRKQFSVLSDLRTHEKHCGDLKWQCSCGTTFSRKDKLMGHVALFIGHTPVIHTSSSSTNISTTTAPRSSTGIKNNVVDQCVVKIGLDDKR